MSVDPLAAATVSMSPYAGMNNDPVRVMDPLGLQGEVNPAYNSTTPILVPYRPLGYWHYQNNSGEQPIAGQMTEDAMQRASDAQRIYQMLQNLGSTGAQGVAASPNNSGESYPNMIQEIVITGSKSEGKGPGFFGRIWGSVKRGVISFLEAGDRLTASKGNDRSYDKDRGGFELKGSDGQNQEKRKGGKNIDEKPIEVDAMMFMFGHGGSGGLGNWSDGFESFNNLVNSFMGMHDATSQLNDVMKPYYKMILCYILTDTYKVFQLIA